jgi:hypothetical protein
MRDLLKPLLLLALVHACGGDRPAPGVTSTGPEVSVEHRPGLQETVYAVEVETCRIRRLANHASVYGELRSVGRAAGVEIRLSSVEKVLVERADRFPFFEVLRSAGALGSDRVPFDCQAWFSLSPLAGPDRDGGL